MFMSQKPGPVVVRQLFTDRSTNYNGCTWAVRPSLGPNMTISVCEKIEQHSASTAL